MAKTVEQDLYASEYHYGPIARRWGQDIIAVATHTRGERDAGHTSVRPSLDHRGRTTYTVARFSAHPHDSVPWSSRTFGSLAEALECAGIPRQEPTDA